MAYRDRWRMEPWPDRRRPPNPRPDLSAPSPRRLDVGPGLPWPVVGVGALAAALVVAWIGLDLGGIGGLIVPVGLAVACVLAVCAVRRDQLFVPAVQPPAVATAAVVGAAVLTGKAGSSTTLALAILAPLAALFWWLLGITVACVVVAVVRSGLLSAGSPR